jgi:hypothetical protein
MRNKKCNIVRNQPSNGSLPWKIKVILISIIQTIKSVIAKKKTTQLTSKTIRIWAASTLSKGSWLRKETENRKEEVVMVISQRALITVLPYVKSLRVGWRSYQLFKVMHCTRVRIAITPMMLRRYITRESYRKCNHLISPIKINNKHSGDQILINNLPKVDSIKPQLRICQALRRTSRWIDLAPQDCLLIEISWAVKEVVSKVFWKTKIILEQETYRENMKTINFQLATRVNISWDTLKANSAVIIWSLKSRLIRVFIETQVTC